MAEAKFSAAPLSAHATAHPMANPGYGKRAAPDQLPRTNHDFAHLPNREASIASYIDRLRDECPVALAVSLHAPTDDLRDRLVPINRKHPLSTLMAACLRYLDRAPRDFITFEYVMLDQVNDQPQHVKALIDLVRDVPCKLNLIPFNPFPGSGFETSPRERIRGFARALQDGGIVATIRKTRGDDIAAACGQLAGQVQDRTKRRLATRIPLAVVR